MGSVCTLWWTASEQPLRDDNHSCEWKKALSEHGHVPFLAGQKSLGSWREQSCGLKDTAVATLYRSLLHA